MQYVRKDFIVALAGNIKFYLYRGTNLENKKLIGSYFSLREAMIEMHQTLAEEHIIRNDQSIVIINSYIHMGYEIIDYGSHTDFFFVGFRVFLTND